MFFSKPFKIIFKITKIIFYRSFMVQSSTTKPTKADDQVNTDKPSAQVVEVAVAVIRYQQRYLLGYRNASQHQGDRYEFVGGKIDKGETASAALIREVSEETAIDISGNQAIKLGRLHHDYGDKHVCLHVYNVELSAAQYRQHKNDKFGLEGQALVWIDQTDLLANKYDLPAANITILAWLSLPALITITYPLAHFATQADSQKEWLKFHQHNIAQNALVYIRVKDKQAKPYASSLLKERSDIKAILPITDSGFINNFDTFLSDSDSDSDTDAAKHNKGLNKQLVASHLNHAEVMTYYDSLQVDFDSNKHLYANQHLVLSCHDVQSIKAANALAKMRLQYNLPPIVAIFLSPVLTTKSHPDTEPLGWQQWSELAQLADMPVIALGGLSPDMSHLASSYGATSIAGIRQFLQHPLS